MFLVLLGCLTDCDFFVFDVSCLAGCTVLIGISHPGSSSKPAASLRPKKSLASLRGYYSIIIIIIVVVNKNNHQSSGVSRGPLFLSREVKDGYSASWLCSRLASRHVSFWKTRTMAGAPRSDNDGNSHHHHNHHGSTNNARKLGNGYSLALKFGNNTDLHVTNTGLLLQVCRCGYEQDLVKSMCREYFVRNNNIGQIPDIVGPTYQARSVRLLGPVME